MLRTPDKREREPKRFAATARIRRETFLPDAPFPLQYGNGRSAASLRRRILLPRPPLHLETARQTNQQPTRATVADFGNVSNKRFPESPSTQRINRITEFAVPTPYSANSSPTEPARTPSKARTVLSATGRKTVDGTWWKTATTGRSSLVQLVSSARSSFFFKRRLVRLCAVRLRRSSRAAAERRFRSYCTFRKSRRRSLQTQRYGFPDRPRNTGSTIPWPSSPP